MYYMYRDVLKQQKFDILGVAETWFRADARHHNFDCEEYKVDSMSMY